MTYLRSGIAYENEVLAEKCEKLIEDISHSHTLVHGDFHTGNVFLQNGEPLLIDMDRVATGHPFAEISDLYYFYVVLGEDDPSVVENFMGFSYQTAQQFFISFLKHYLGTEDENKLNEIMEKASLLCCIRQISKIRSKVFISETERKKLEYCVEKLSRLTGKIDSLIF